MQRPSAHRSILGGDGDPIIPALLRVSGEPTRWDELAEVFGSSSTGDETMVETALEVLTALAELSRGHGEGCDSEGAPPELGVVLVSPRGRVLAANALAQAAIVGLGSVEVGGRLTFDDEGNASAVTAALDEAQRDGARVALRLQGSTGEGPRFAYAMPAAALVSGKAGAELGALLIFAPASEAQGTWTLVRRSFGLTDAELVLARALCDGLSLQQAADDLARSVHTVRNQLRSIFDKMGLQRQSDLVRAVHEFGKIGGAVPAPTLAESDAPPIQRMRLPDGRTLAWREYGDPAGAHTLLTFHEGLGSSLLPPGTDARARNLGLRVLAPERPGFGQSDPMPDGYDFEAIAEDMVCFLEARRVDRVRIGAVLSGAPPALHTAERLGARVEFVMLCSGRPPWRMPAQRHPSLFVRMRAGLEAHAWAADALFAIVRLRKSHGLTRQMLAQSTAESPGDAAFLAEHPEFAEYVSRYVGECLARTSRGVAEEVKAFRRSENKPRPDFAAPVIVWHGAEDGFAPLADLLDYLGEPDELRVFEGVGHFMAPRHWDEILRRAAA